MKFWRWVYQWKWTWYVIAYLFCIMVVSWVIVMTLQGITVILFLDQLPAWFMILMWLLWVVPTVLYIIYHYDKYQMRGEE